MRRILILGGFTLAAMLTAGCAAPCSARAAVSQSFLDCLVSCSTHCAGLPTQRRCFALIKRCAKQAQEATCPLTPTTTSTTPTTTTLYASTTTTTLPAVSTGYYTIKDTTGPYTLRFYLVVQGGVIVGGWVDSQTFPIDLGHSLLTTSALTLQTLENGNLVGVWLVNVSLPSMNAQVTWTGNSYLSWNGTVVPGIQ